MGFRCVGLKGIMGLKSLGLSLEVEGVVPPSDKDTY